MRKKSTLKRMLAGILAISTALSAVPMQMATTVLAAEDYTSESNAEYMYELLNYLSELGDDYGLPPIMISEGDKVFIDGQEVATTVVPINKDLVNKQNKIRSEYWLDVLRAGTYDELKADSEALKTYFDTEMQEYNEYDVSMRDTLIAMRDYCIANGLTKDAIWEDVEILYGYKSNSNDIIKQIYNILNSYKSTQVYEPVGNISTNNSYTGGYENNYNSYNKETATKPQVKSVYEQPLAHVYLRKSDSVYLSNAELPAYEDVQKDIYASKFTDNYKRLQAGYDLVNVVDGLTSHMEVVSDDLCDIASSLDVLIGDTSIDSATYIDSQLAKMKPEDMLYAYAGVYTNLYRVNQYLDDSYFDLYVPIDAVTLADARIIDLDSVRYNISELPDGIEYAETPYYEYVQTGRYSGYYQLAAEIVSTKSIITSTMHTKMLEVNDILDTQVGSINDTYTNALNGLGNLVATEYSFENLGTADVIYNTVGDAGAKAEKANAIIDNIPENLMDAWRLLYDSRLGIEAVDNSFVIETFADYYERKQNILDDNWDYSSTIYDAIKYVNTKETIDGTLVTVKKALTDENGNEKSYGKQNEVTPWISMDALADNEDYRNLMSYEMWRNPIDADYESYNPQHPLKYDSSNSKDLVTLLKSNGYTQEASEKTTFNLQAMEIKVDRYALDSMGADYGSLIHQTISLSETDNLQYQDMFMLYDYIRDVEYGLIDDTVVDNFKKFLTDVQITDETTVKALVDAYLHDMSGFNAHNGYAITLTFIYDTEEVVDIQQESTALTDYQKVLLAEIPEYSISEYYEDKKDLFEADEMVSNIFDKDSALSAQLEMFKNNPEKLLTKDSIFEFAVDSDVTTGWDTYLDTFVKNKTLNTISGVYTVPEGTALRLPAYVPVSGRTFDTRYFIKYIPYNTTVLPDVSDWRYYATAFTSKMPLNSLGAFTNVNGESANGFVALDVAADKTNKLTVMYAQDRGATMYRAMQRLLSPVQQFTVVGNDTYNMNTHLTVNEIASGLTGYTTNGMALAVADIGLPNLVWDANTGTIYNQVEDKDGNVSLTQTYGGDIHLWLSKETEKDGILIADWVNPVPTSLQDALQATNTTTGTYQNGENVTSTEMPSRVSSGENIVVIDQGTTEGTYATWAFERKLVKSEGLSYCAKCNKVVLEFAHKTFHATTYQTVGRWESSRVWVWDSTDNVGGYGTTDGVTSINGVKTDVQHASPENTAVAKVQEQNALGFGGQQYGAILEDLQVNGTSTSTYEITNGQMEIVATSREEANNLIIELIQTGVITAETVSQIDTMYPGRNTPANPTDKDDGAIWRNCKTNIDSLIEKYGEKPTESETEDEDKESSGHYETSWSYREAVDILHLRKTVCDGATYPVTIWTLGDYGVSEYVGTEEMLSGELCNFNITETTTTEKTGVDSAIEKTTYKQTVTPMAEKSNLMIDFYYSSVPETRNIIGTGNYTYVSESGAKNTRKTLIDGGITEGTYQLGVSGMLPLGVEAEHSLHVYLQPNRSLCPDPNYNSWSEKDSVTEYSIEYAARNLAPDFGTYNSILNALKELINYFPETDANNAGNWQSAAVAKGYVPADGKTPYTHAISYLNSKGKYANIKAMSIPTINPRTWGVVVSESLGAAVVPMYDLDYVYNLAVKGSLVEEKSYAALIARSLKDNKSPKVLNDTRYLVRYVDSIFDLVADDSDASSAPNLDNIDSTMGGTPEDIAKTFYKVAGDVKTGNINAMIIPLNDTEGTKEEYTLLDTGSTDGETTGTRKVTVVTPKLTYIPYTVINNIEGVTRDGDDLEFDYTEKTEIVTEDILGKELIHEYRSETQDSVFPANIVPEVLMTFKEHFLTPEGDLKEYEDRGKVDSVYIAAYNEYSMELPSFSRTSLYSDIGPDDFKVAGTMVAVTQAAKALSSIFDVLYTGSDVNVMIESDTTPEIEFHSYVVDFADTNVGRAWNAGYTATTADQQAQLYVDRYKNDEGKFEYNAVLSNTFDKVTNYSGGSNAKNVAGTDSITDKSSTITVDGRTMEPLTVSETFEFDIVNSKGETNQTELVDTYAIEIRNGRLASITVDGLVYNLYGSGTITTTEQLVASAGFAALKAAHYELAEAVVHLELPEFASTLVHNGGSQTWQSYRGTGIYEDNTGRSVVAEVEDIKGQYDVNFDGTDGWYGEDVTTLVIKEYKLRGELEDDYAFSYKVPLDYGYKSPRSKSDLFKAGTALYAYNELYFEFLNKVEITTESYTGASSSTFDVVGDEGTGICVQTPEIGYVISNATVDDMYAR